MHHSWHTRGTHPPTSGSTVSLRRHRFYCSAALVIAACASTVAAQTDIAYPVLRGFDPVALQAGTTTEIEVKASNDLRGTFQVMVMGNGVTGEVVPPAPPPETKPGEAPPALAKLKLRFTATADAIPGPRHVRLLSPRGASTLAEVVVVRDPVVSEAADNNTPAKAQVLPSLPAVVCGQIEAKEDVDCFRFRVDVPQALTFHLWGERLQHVLNDIRGRQCIDAMLTLRSASGATLATADNVFGNDPLLVYPFTEPGDYVLEVRDVRYHGWGEYWGYAIEINPRPFIRQAIPLAVAPGVEQKLALVGFNVPADASALLTLSADAAEGVQRVSPSVQSPGTNGIGVNGFSVVASRLPIVLEATDDNDLPVGGQLITLPACLAGRIGTPGDVDCFRFEAKKGDLVSFACIARQAGSPLDPYLRILDDKGQQLAEADDTKYSLFTLVDPELEGWTAPADGTFAVELRDVVAAGGPEFGYVLQVTRSEPRFRLEANSGKTPLAPGVGCPIYVRVERRNGFTGDVQLAIDGLPPGVTADCGRILASGNDGCIILKAAADAPTGAANIRITGSASHPLADGSMLALSAVARPLEEVQQDGGGRGLVPVLAHTVSVADPMEVRAVELSASALSLKPGESKSVEVRLERKPGYKGNITLDALFQHLGIFGNSLPKGVTVDTGASQAILTGEAAVGSLTLKAAADAPPVEAQLVPIMVHVTINFSSKMTVCEPLRVSVTAVAK